MSKKLSVADAKKHLSELMSRVAYNKERFLIERRGKPMAALVSATVSESVMFCISGMSFWNSV